MEYIDYLINAALIMLAIGSGVAIFAGITIFLVEMYDFEGGFYRSGLTALCGAVLSTFAIATLMYRASEGLF